MTIKPLADRVVVKLVEAEEKTKAGIILTASAQEKPQIAEVVAVGPGGIVDGNEVVMTVKVGDKVITSKYAGTEVKCDGVEYNIVRQSDILAIVECICTYRGCARLNVYVLYHIAVIVPSGTLGKRPLIVHSAATRDVKISGVVKVPIEILATNAERHYIGLIEILKAE